MPKMQLLWNYKNALVSFFHTRRILAFPPTLTHTTLTHTALVAHCVLSGRRARRRERCRIQGESFSIFYLIFNLQIHFLCKALWFLFPRKRRKKDERLHLLWLSSLPVPIVPSFSREPSRMSLIRVVLFFFIFG